MCRLSAFLGQEDDLLPFVIHCSWSCHAKILLSHQMLKFGHNACTIILFGLPLLVLFVREISIHVVPLIFLQITSIFQWYINRFHALYPSTDLGLNIEDWEGKVQVVTAVISSEFLP